MLREIRDHKAPETGIVMNEDLTVRALDVPDPSSACHLYYIEGLPHDPELAIRFQQGPIREVGINGITNEILLAIVIDRLRSFQSGPYECDENAWALTYCEQALEKLHDRTIERAKRGVEGTSAA